MCIYIPQAVPLPCFISVSPIFPLQTATRPLELIPPAVPTVLFCPPMGVRRSYIVGMTVLVLTSRHVWHRQSTSAFNTSLVHPLHSPPQLSYSHTHYYHTNHISRAQPWAKIFVVGLSRQAALPVPFKIGDIALVVCARVYAYTSADP